MEHLDTYSAQCETAGPLAASVCLTAEYNDLVDAYNDLLRSRKLLEQGNLKKAREIINARQIIR